MVWSSLEGPFSQVSVGWASGSPEMPSKGRAVGSPGQERPGQGEVPAYRNSASGCSADLAAAAAVAGPASSSGEERTQD